MRCSTACGSPDTWLSNAVELVETSWCATCLFDADSSEHHELDVLPGKNCACGGERVAANDEVLCEGVDVAQPTLERAIGVKGGSASSAIRSGDDRCRTFDRPHGG